MRRMVCMYTMINSKFMTEAIRKVRSFASPLSLSVLQLAADERVHPVDKARPRG